jgi:hypothetical protein
MAQIKTEQLVLEVSKLFKNNEDAQILSDEQVETLIAVVEATVAELINDSSLIVEVNRFEA